MQTTESAVEPLQDIHRLVNDLAMQVVMGDETEKAGERPEWFGLLDQIIEVSDSEFKMLATEAAKLRRELLSCQTKPEEFSRIAEAGVQCLQETVEAMGTANIPAPSPACGAGIADDPELIADFVVEAREHLQGIEQSVLALEQDPTSVDPIHSMFRAFHTIKGIAGFLEFQDIREVSHETETLLDLARNGMLALNPAVIDVILEAADYLSREVTRIECGSTGAAAPTAQLIRGIRSVLNDNKGNEIDNNLDALAKVLTPANDPAALCEESQTAGQASPRNTKFETAVQESVTSGTESAVEDVKATRANTRSGVVTSSIKVDTAKLDFLVDAVGEMVIAQSLVSHNPELAKLQSAALMRNIAQLSRITAEVQKTAMSMRMVPVGLLFQKMARLVRDLCRKSGKQAELVTFGEDTELDRNIVEELADPLMHMIRNAADHGIETPEERMSTGKPAVARIELRASHQGGHIQIEIADDGRGMSRDKILKKAIDKGIVQSGANLSDSDIYNLIFEPGFSTAEKVTDISGRGVGMDVVQRQIQKLRGRAEIQTELGKGTTFQLKLPLTLAIIDGLVIGVGAQRYIVPIFAVKEMLRPVEGMVSTIEGKREFAVIRERVLPVVRLYRRFGIKPSSENPLESLLILTESHGMEYCLMVDTLIGKQEVVIKSLGETMKNVSGVAGGAILGDGRVALILDMNALFNPSRVG
jgi:two-component system chemotaxis sensor kinase CheA